MTGAPTLDALAETLRAGGGLLAEAVAPADAVAAERAEYGDLAASGPRAAAAPDEYALLVEAIYEGYLQHYGAGRVLQTEDPDLALLAGDRLYALGLARLAALGDLEAVVVLAEVISRCAQVHAEGRAGDAAAVWEQGARAVGHGQQSHR